MTSNYIFTASNGVIIPDTSDIKTTVQSEFSAAFQDLGELSLEDSTPQGRLIDVETNARTSVIAYNAEIANVLINIAMSSGSILDAWGANFDIPREGATPSSVAVSVTGIVGTIITANSEAIDDNGIIWKCENEIIIGSNGTATGTFICSQTGPIELSTGELNKIVASSTTGIDGWETIINTASATLGTTIEADTPYKLRILQSIFTGTALFGNYSSACYKVDGVRDVFSYDNPTNATKQLDNITIPAHSVYVCVDGGNATDVAYALYTVKSAGCGWTGNTTVNVTDPTYKTTNPVQFEIPSNVNIVVSVNATSILNSNADLEADIQNVVYNYLNNQYESLGYSKIGIRVLLDPFILASVIQTQIAGITVNNVKIGLKTPVNHAVVSIIKASVTSGITWASVTASTFATAVSNVNGTYNFIYNGSNWKLNNNNVNLATYGVVITGTPVNNDKISVLYATGNEATSPIQLYANEKPVISVNDITVNINE